MSQLNSNMLIEVAWWITIIFYFSTVGFFIYPPARLIASKKAGYKNRLWRVILLVETWAMGALNFITTIISMRAGGLWFFWLPLFVWASFITVILLLLSLLVLTDGITMSLINSNLSTNFFQYTGNKDYVLHQYLSWFFDYSEVYILFFIVNVVKIFNLENNLTKVIPIFKKPRYISTSSLVSGSFVLNFPDAAEYCFPAHNLHFEVMAASLFAVGFVTYSLFLMFFWFRQPVLRVRSVHIKLKDLIYLEFFWTVIPIMIVSLLGLPILVVALHMEKSLSWVAGQAHVNYSTIEYSWYWNYFINEIVSHTSLYSLAEFLHISEPVFKFDMLTHEKQQVFFGHQVKSSKSYLLNNYAVDENIRRGNNLSSPLLVLDLSANFIEQASRCHYLPDWKKLVSDFSHANPASINSSARSTIATRILTHFSSNDIWSETFNKFRWPGYFTTFTDMKNVGLITLQDYEGLLCKNGDNITYGIIKQNCLDETKPQPFSEWWKKNSQPVWWAVDIVLLFYIRVIMGRGKGR